MAPTIAVFLVPQRVLGGFGLSLVGPLAPSWVLCDHDSIMHDLVDSSIATATEMLIVLGWLVFCVCVVCVCGVFK